MSAPASAPVPVPTFDRSAIVAALKEMRLQIEAIEWSLGGVQYLPPCDPPCEPAPEPVSASDAEKPKKERKPRGPMSEEKKAAMNAKRVATMAAKAAAAPSSPVKGPAPKPVAPGAPKKAPKEHEFDDGYTYTELNTFAPVTFDGVECGVNKRGDVVNNKSGAFMGHFDHTTKTLDRTAPEPTCWEDISCINDLDVDE